MRIRSLLIDVIGSSILGVVVGYGVFYLFRPDSDNFVSVLGCAVLSTILCVRANWHTYK